MFLKKIHISGFKSFADKITIPFDQGITGIVGPNGSGKSNVIDAVRWVMGEQNARNLRGKVATDIVFAGSENRKALGMAEVTLIFDNADESAFCPPEYRHEPEISLTRRLYVDGQREYMINRKSCRYKDIVSFFSTTGLGGRSYSMIQQGQVDRILNAKPEDVRIILEEAAGTLVYKTRRDEALKKLDQTQENLSRIEDIVSELDRQQKTLESQMEKAKKWKEFTDELKEKELSLYAHSYHELNDKRRELQETINAHSAAEVELLSELAKLDAEQEELQNSLDASDPDLEGLHEQVTTIREQIARAENTILNCGERTRLGKARLEELAKEIDADATNLKAIEEQVAAATSEVREAEEKAEELRQMIDSFQDQVDAVDEEAQAFQNRIDDYEDELKSIDRLLESNGLRCETINRERSKLVEDLQQTEERLQTLRRETSETEQIVSDSEKKVAAKQEGLDQEVQAKNDLDAAIKERQAEIAAAAEERDTAKEAYFSTRGRLTSLQELEQSASDVATTLAELKEHDESVEGLVAGLLTDFIAFNDTAQELSLHTRNCFERWAERLVVDSLANLNDLVRTAHQAESASLPVSLLSEWELTNKQDIDSWAERCDATPLRTFVKVTREHAQLGKLIDRIFFLSNISLDEADLKDLPTGVIAFTAQGLRLASREEFTIGHSQESRGILSRKEEIEELGKELKTIEGTLATAQASIDTLETKQREDQLARTEIEERLQNQNQDVLEVLGELQGAQQLLEHKRELLSTSETHVENCQASDRSLVEELEEQGRSRIELGTEQERVKEELESLREESGSIEEKRTEVFRIHEGRKLDLAKSEARAQALQQSFDSTRQQLERVQETLTRRYDERARIESDIELAATDEERSKSEIEVLLVKRETLEEELTAKREENASVLEALKDVDAKLKIVRENSQKSQNDSNAKKVELERIQVGIEAASEQAKERYDLDIATHQFERDPDFHQERLTKEVQKLKRRIDGLGAINMMAIEEYEQLMERHSFITAQREEVTNSINLLEDALEEIEETSKTKFLETFHAINEEFGNLFPILFTGGTGRLELTTPEDPLNAGVDILVRLPGKKAQRMTLLSGGEKALTAISLIFALLKTKPTPFCFLDEVDAPLDEANVGRYNKVLETLSDRFQFIVITHNRRTMEVLDTLYGVTMQEPGVSKIVGVDMQKDLPAHLKKAFKERPVEGASAQA